LPSSVVCTMPGLPTLPGEFYSALAAFSLTVRSPDGQAMMLSSADGYCSIVVFDLGELGAVHPTQQHHRQLAAIAHSHGGSSSAAATPMPLSPSVATMRASPAPPRSERESSTASSIPTAGPTQPPLFPYARPPSSTASSDHPLPTPSDEWDSVSASGLRRPSNDSVSADDPKRARADETGAPKKKRRVALNPQPSD
jgi:chromatin assembly factor 1 subunit B